MSYLVPVGSIEKGRADGLDALRERLTNRVALKPFAGNTAFWGRGLKPKRYSTDDLCHAVLPDEDEHEVRPRAAYAWPVSDVAGVGTLLRRLRTSADEDEFLDDSLGGVDPSDPGHVLVAVGREPGVPMGFLHAVRRITLDWNSGSPSLGYWFDIKSLYITPLERGRRASYTFVALVDDLVWIEIEKLGKAAGKHAPGAVIAVHVSGEVVGIPDNRLMYRFEVALSVMRDVISDDMPDNSLDLTVDYDHIPLMFAQPRFPDERAPLAA